MRAFNHTHLLSRAGKPALARRAFSVIELMLAVAIMGVIVFALYSVFNQTQRALRATEAMSDVSERGRVIVEMISRELEQAQPTFVGYRGIMGTNLMGGIEYPPRVQSSDRSDITPRTNYLHNIFFYTNHTNAWQGIGYRVVNVTNGVGVLERFETNVFGHRPLPIIPPNANPPSLPPPVAFMIESLTNATYHHVADGVIHLAFIPYDSHGYRLGYDTTNKSPGIYAVFRANSSGKSMGNRYSDVIAATNANVFLMQGEANPSRANNPYITDFAFKSNAMPAYIDLEFGVLEPETMAQYRLMLEDNNANASKFLERQIGKVHLFRHRIAIRTAAQ